MTRQELKDYVLKKVDEYVDEGENQGGPLEALDGEPNEWFEDFIRYWYYANKS